MPAMDEDLRLVDSQDIDISETPDNAEAAVNLGRGGLPAQSTFVVIIEATTAETVEPVIFELQFTDDNSTWHTVGTITLNDLTVKGCYAVPVGLANFSPESLASDDIDVRVNTRWTEVEVADDITYSAFLAGPQSFPFFN